MVMALLVGVAAFTSMPTSRYTTTYVQTPEPTPTRPTPPPSPTPTSAPTATKPTPVPTTAKPTPKPTTKPTKPATSRHQQLEPSRPVETDYPTTSPPVFPKTPAVPVRTLTANKLYTLSAVPHASCPSPPQVYSSARALQVYYQGMIDCLDAAWQPIKKAKGANLAKPKLVMFNGSVHSACGLIEWHAVYCGDDNRIYVSTSMIKSGADFPFWIDQTITHEYMHHVQMAFGIMRARWNYKEAPIIVSRRTELQANCLETQMAFRAPKAPWRMEIWWYAYSGDAKHGSLDAIRRWGLYGYQKMTPAACNTWAVAANQVPYK